MYKEFQLTTWKEHLDDECVDLEQCYKLDSSGSKREPSSSINFTDFLHIPSGLPFTGFANTKLHQHFPSLD
jgi:hypothetical protein